MLQSALTSLIVAGAAGYSAWALMPRAWQQGLARRLGRQAAPVAGCGGCGGCDTAPKAEPKPQVIQIHRRSAGPSGLDHNAAR